LGEWWGPASAPPLLPNSFTIDPKNPEIIYEKI